MLDRGPRNDWFRSTEIQIEAIIAALAFYLFIVHTITATDRSFLNRDLLKNPNFVAGTVLMFLIGGILSGTLALIPSMLQNLMEYPVMLTGLITSPRGFGTMAAMFIVGRLIGKVDSRLLILFGLALTAISLWQMTGFSLQMGRARCCCRGCCRGSGSAAPSCRSIRWRCRTCRAPADPGHRVARGDAQYRRQYRDLGAGRAA